jgi:hypothetical protein
MKLSVYLNPTCDDCEKEAKNITKNHSKYDNYQVIFVSNTPELKLFADKVHINLLKNVYPLEDLYNQKKLNALLFEPKIGH